MIVTGLDTETTLIKEAEDHPKMVCFSYSDGNRCKVSKDSGVRELVQKESDVLVGVNLPFDYGVIRKSGSSTIFDCSAKAFSCEIAEELLAIERGDLYPKDPEKSNKKIRYSLKWLSNKYLGIQVDKSEDTWRLRYGELLDVPVEQWPKEAVRYAEEDARLPVLIREQQLKIKSPNLDPEFIRLENEFRIEARMASRIGLITDQERVSQLRDKVSSELDGQRTSLRESGIYDEDGHRSNTKLRELVLAAYGGSDPKSPSGASKYDTSTCMDSGDPILQKYASSTFNSTMLSKYIPLIERPVIRSDRIQIAETTRCTFTDAVQQIPREGGVRECIVAPPDHVFIAVDIVGAEAATLAQSCYTKFGHSTLREALNAKADIHQLLADTFGGPRQSAKAANYGFPGGMGVAKFVSSKRGEGIRFCADPHCRPTVTIFRGRRIPPCCPECLKIAAKLKDAWFHQWPEMREFLDWIGIQYKTDKIIAPGDTLVRGNVDFCSAANHCFQRPAARGFKRAFVQASKELRLSFKSSTTLLPLHDEIFAQSHITEYRKALPIISEILVTEMRKICPDVRISVSGAVMKHWSKNAKYRTNERGALIPWDLEEMSQNEQRMIASLD